MRAAASLIYVPNSTTVNDVPIRDVGVFSALSSERGIVLNDVDPGVEATIRFRDVVHNGLPAGEAIMRVATVHYDGERHDEMPSNELKVRATPVFANAIPGLPFGLDGMVGPAFGGGQRMLTEDRLFMELPPATPVSANGDVSGGRIAGPDYPALVAATNGSDVDGGLAGDRVGVSVTFTAERHRARAALPRRSAFRWPGDASVRDARVLPRSDRRYARRRGRVDARDVARRNRSAFHQTALAELRDRAAGFETASTRATLERPLHDVHGARGTPAETPGAAWFCAAATIRRRSPTSATRREKSNWPQAFPWAILARFLPDGTAQFAHYRTMLVARLDSFDDSDSTEFWMRCSAVAMWHSTPRLTWYARRCTQTLSSACR